MFGGVIVMYSSYARQNGNSLYSQGTAMPAPCRECGSKALSMEERPVLPTGVPTGPSTGSVTGVVPAAQIQGGTPSTAGQSPLTTQNIMYTPGFLSTQIGRLMRVEFLIGTNGPLIDRVGTLVGVGASYILLRPSGTDDVLLCDIYSIKFVTILL